MDTVDQPDLEYIDLSFKLITIKIEIRSVAPIC